MPSLSGGLETQDGRSLWRARYWKKCGYLGLWRRFWRPRILCAASSDYQQRREELRKELKNGVTVLFGRSLRDSSDLRSGFFQEPNFYYLTGWMEPGAILLLAERAARNPVRAAARSGGRGLDGPQARSRR